MGKTSNPSYKGSHRCQKSVLRAELELEMASLMDKLSHIYNSTKSFTEVLESAGCSQSSATTVEVEVMLKNALRLLGEAMSQLPRT